jgi:peptidyl-prolyl cis-trans isomerase-like 3
MAVTLHTSLGDIKLEIYCDLCPRASENFLALAASGQYNGTKFHRNMAGFMVQGGDPTGTGKGGECIWGGKFEDEIIRELSFDRRGVLAMANRGPDTNAAQFFITYTPQTHLNLKYTIFGQIIDGHNTLDAIERVPVAGKKHRPVDDILIKNITIHANPLAKTY